jgi:hypothetical protein
MKKVHSRRKKRLGLNTKRSHYYFFHGNTKVKGERTFKTVEVAQAWAKENGLTVDQYTIVPTKHNRKFKIVKNKM